MTLLASILIGYLIGCIPVGLLAGKLHGIDIRDVGSGNIGATNVWRALGPTAGISVFVLDVLKGVASVMAGRWVGGSQTAAVLAGVAVICGHNWSLFLGFRGGRGVAASLGVGFALLPLHALAAWGVWAVVLAATRMVSAASMAAGLSLPLLCAVAPRFGVLPALDPAIQILGSLAGVFIVIRHRENWRRIRAGTEPRVGRKKRDESAGEDGGHEQ